MACLFVSYRRSDSQGWAGRLAADLARAFGDVALFLDTESIAPGEDFARALDGAIGRAEAMLVLIGPRWLSARGEGDSRRLDDPADFVRREIAAGLAGGLRVIPVLLGGAAMVKAEQLPEPIAQLAARQAFELSDTRWDYDCDRLLQAIERNTSTRRRPQADRQRDPIDGGDKPGAINVANGMQVSNSKVGDIVGIKHAGGRG